MKAKDIMTENVICKSSDSTLSEVSEDMKANDIGLIPILDNDKIIGVITDRDITIRCLVNKADSNAKVIKYITNEVIFVSPNDDIEKVVNLMQEHQIKRILVVDSDKIVGIIALADLINRNDDEMLVLNTITNIYKPKTLRRENQAEVDDYPL
jgi:CBS domain-containing protein